MFESPTTHNPGLVSIMMPAYNAERYIGQAIESVINQTYRRWELIIVNDGSSDHTGQVIDSFSDDRIIKIDQPNSGEAAARNTALGMMRGEFLAFLDADDEYTPEFLGQMVIFLNQHPHRDGVYCDGYFIDETGNTITTLSNERRGPFEGDLFEQLVRASDVFGPPMSVVLRASKIRGLNETFDIRIVIGPDWDFFTRVSQHLTFGYNDAKLCRYRVHQTNITLTAGNQRKIESLILCRQKASQLPRFEECSPETRAYLFYDLLINLLKGQSARQAEVIAAPAFRNIPTEEQSRLLRLMAVEEILMDPRSLSISTWLTFSTRLNSKDWKGRLLLFAFRISPRLAQKGISLRNLLREKKKPSSPFFNPSSTKE